MAYCSVAHIKKRTTMAEAEVYKHSVSLPILEETVHKTIFVRDLVIF